MRENIFYKLGMPMQEGKKLRSSSPSLQGRKKMEEEGKESCLVFSLKNERTY